MSRRRAAVPRESELRAALADGLNLSEIGFAHGRVGRAAVARWLRSYGIPVPRPGMRTGGGITSKRIRAYFDANPHGTIEGLAAEVATVTVAQLRGIIRNRGGLSAILGRRVRAETAELPAAPDAVAHSAVFHAAYEGAARFGDTAGCGISGPEAHDIALALRKRARSVHENGR